MATIHIILHLLIKTYISVTKEKRETADKIKAGTIPIPEDIPRIIIKSFFTYINKQNNKP